MRISTRLANVAALATTMVLSLTACGDEPGAANPGPTTAPTSASTSGGPTTDQPSSELASVKACDLLTDQEAATINRGLEAEDEGAFAGSSSSCGWSTSIDRGVHPDEGVTFGVYIRPSQKVDEVLASPEAKVTTGKVGTRPAKQVAEDGGIQGGCLLSFAVGTGRVDIIVERPDQPTEQACKDASAISTIIEPKLPKA